MHDLGLVFSDGADGLQMYLRNYTALEETPEVRIPSKQNWLNNRQCDSDIFGYYLRADAMHE
jgi:hypothetical protein